MLYLAKLSTILLFAIFTAQCSEEAGFNGSNNPESKDGDATTNSGSEETNIGSAGGESMADTGGGAGTPGSENIDEFKFDPAGEDIPETCSNKHRALRLTIVVDNSGSNACDPNKVYDPTAEQICGTDPKKKNDGERDGVYTDRQKAIHQLITKTVSEDNRAREKNPDFVGSAFGLTSFPFDGSAAGLAKSKIHSGDGSVLPGLMTESKSINLGNDFETGLWNLLKFTHTSGGATPYKTALEGAKKVVHESNDPADPRAKVVLFITDGIPTDQRPSTVVEARKALGDDVHVILLSLYIPGNSLEAQNAPAKNSLKEAWDSPTKNWGRQPNNNDGFNAFEDYWNRLLALPNEISNNAFDIQGSSGLTQAIDTILERIQTCQLE
jgi:hypothetical protein